METISKINKVEDYYDYTCLAPIIDKISDVSMMEDYERAFLNSLIRKYRPKKLLELGVAKGGSSVVMLNAIKDIEDAKLYSIDYVDYVCWEPSKKVGYAVEERTPELADKWVLKSNALACDFMEEIGGDIDFCLIDTVHSNPGEILDFLMVLPYLKKNAVVVFHDTALAFLGYKEGKSSTCTTNNMLMSVIKGIKIIPEYHEFIYPNIAAIVLSDDVKKNVWDLFNIILQPWAYKMPDKDIEKLKLFFEKTYGSELTRIFDIAVDTYNEQKPVLKGDIPIKYTFWERIFSVKNSTDRKHKIFSIFGIKISFLL